MVYLDNAATGGFKTSSVLEKANIVMRYLCANPGRSAHRLSLKGAEIVYECRKLLADFTNCSPERVIFTKNCTEALNLAIFGTLKVGGHIITTVYEHNSVLRPLIFLKEKGLIELDIVHPTSSSPIENEIESKLKPNTYLIVTTAVSNVTGEQLPIAQIGKIAKSKGIFYLVDGAQGGGHINLDLQSQNINMLALAGHKGLYGIMGSGVLVFDNFVTINPIIFGGTGNMSFSLNQPLSYPESLEAGTLNLPAIACLSEGVKYISSNLDNFAKHLVSYTKTVINAFAKIDAVKCFSTPNPCGIVAFSIDGISSEDFADRLNKEFDIAVRGGFHCAPLMHKFLCTEQDGLVRASFCVQNSSAELDHLIRAVNIIAKNKN